MTLTGHLLYALAWLSFGLLHSLLARGSAKRFFSASLGRAYRLAYNGLALLHLLAIGALGEVLGRGLPWGRPDWLAILQGALLLAGALVLFFALRAYDLGRFGGLTQWRQRIPPQEEAAEEPLRLSPLHRYVRHPIYSGALLLLWGLVRDELSLATAFWASLYLVVGSRFEERDLLKRFGQAYADYRAKVPALFPWRGKVGF
jgi:protein-S-isoprenylcysteine O-methyltransferase Ste14